DSSLPSLLLPSPSSPTSPNGLKSTTHNWHDTFTRWEQTPSSLPGLSSEASLLTCSHGINGSCSGTTSSLSPTSAPPPSSSSSPPLPTSSASATPCWVPRRKWDVIEKERVPLSSIVIGVGSAAAVGGYFFKRRWALRNEQLVNDFVDDMMGAGMDTSELYRIAMSYKAKLGPFATPRILNEYLKAVFRAPDLSSSFVEAMDLVVNQLLKVKDQELVDAIAEIAREMAKGQEFVGMSILLFTFERILPPALSETQLEPLRRALGKALPGNVEDNMFELAKDAYSLEVESLFIRGENPVLAPEGYEVMGLPFDEAEKVFKRVKRSYEGNDAQHDGGTEGGEDLGASLIVRRKEPLHDMIYGKAEDIA
ncbi:hypothetical protein VYU27_010260, partial [Nannochloropsis oceanica]